MAGSTHARLPLLLALAFLPAACAGGMDLDRLAADRSLVTGSIGTAPASPQEGRASDEAAIRAAVASWPAGTEPPELIPWVNARTGSSGAIEKIEAAVGGCSAFTASRESFDGVGLYRGRACRSGTGGWLVEALKEP